MTSIQPSHAWQLAAVSMMGRVTVVALCALALESLVVRSSFSSAWMVAALVAVPLMVAIRVARGFEQSLPAAIATFAAAAVIGTMTSGATSVAICVVGIAAAISELRLQSRQPTIELTRTNRDGPEPVVIRR